MSFRAVAGFSCAFSLAACNLGKTDDQSRPLPAPEPASSTPPSRPAVAAAPTPTPRPKEPAAPKPTATTTPTAETPPPEPTATATATATSTSDASGAATATPTALPTPTLPPFDAGTIGTTCLPKCQASLSACISKPVPLDAGFPSLESMAACKKLFEECRSACN